MAIPNALKAGELYKEKEKRLWDVYQQGQNALTSGLATGRSDITSARDVARGDVSSARDVAVDDVWKTYEKGAGYFQPYREAGSRGLTGYENALQAGPGEFTESPGYQFRQDEAMKNLARTASARGYLTDPRQAKEMMEVSQGLASDERARWLDEYYRNLAAYGPLAEMGLGAAGATAELGAGAARQSGEFGMRAGENLATLSTTAGQNLAQLEQQAAVNRAGLGERAAQTALQGGLAAVQADQAYDTNLQKMDLEWSRLGLAEIEAHRDRLYKSGQADLQRAHEMAMAEKGYDWYKIERDRQEDDNWWNNLFGFAGGVIGGYLK